MNQNNNIDMTNIFIYSLLILRNISVAKDKVIDIELSFQINLSKREK